MDPVHSPIPPATRTGNGKGQKRRSLGVFADAPIPVVAWRAEATAWDLCSRLKDDDAAESHRACAEAHILGMAHSFAPDEPLRQSFLAAPPVRRILGSRKLKAGGSFTRATLD